MSTCTCTCTNYLYVAYTSLLGPPTCPSINQDPTFTQPQQRQGGAKQNMEHQPKLALGQEKLSFCTGKSCHTVLEKLVIDPVCPSFGLIQIVA